MTLPGKLAPGLKGFPTPEPAADVMAYLLFLFPDPTWSQYILGACRDLVVEYNWYQSGALLPEEASEALRLIIQQAPYNLVDRNIQAPFWDEESGDDADDELTPEEQDWYGRWDGETFAESLAYVVLTNFLSGLVSTQAAIKFLAIPRLFRVAIKANPHGAKLLLFLDGGLYAVINGYSVVDQVVETVVRVLPSGALRAEADEPVELLLVHSGEHDPAATPDANGNYPIDVIRGRLAASDVTPANMRYNPDCDCVQVTPDGGTTWNDAPGSDPRRAPAYRLPPRTGTDRKCDAAANMVAWVKNFMDEIIADLSDIGTAGLIVSTALNAWSLLFEPIAIVDLIADAASVIGGFGSSVLDAAFDTTAYDQLLCIFYCNSDADGQVSPEAFTTIQDQVASTLNATAAIVMALILGAQGEVGLSNAGAIGSETGDCSACECCPDGYKTCLDFTASNYGISLGLGTWVAGVGFVFGDTSDGVHYYRGVWFSFAILSGNVKKITVEFSGSAGSFATTITDRIYQNSDLSGNWLVSGTSLVSSPFIYTGNVDGASALGVTLTCGFSNPASGSLTVTGMIVEGDDCTVVVGGIDCL